EFRRVPFRSPGSQTTSTRSAESPRMRSSVVSALRTEASNSGGNVGSMRSVFGVMLITSPPGAEELLDAAEDRLAVGDAADDHVLVRVGQLVDVLEELAAAVGRLRLPVPEQVQLRH